MSLSIVIPAYNSARTIARCLQSIADQGLEGLQVVVVDDGSSDDIADRVADFKVDLDLVYVRQPNSGVSVARNQGVSHASGDWVAFVDADDCLPARSLGPFFRFAAESGAEVCVGDFIMRQSDGDATFANINSAQVMLGERDRTVLQRMCIASIGFGNQKNVGLLGAPWAKIYKRQFLLEVFTDGQLFQPGIPRSEDVLFNVEVFGRVRSVAYFHAPVYVYVLDSLSYSHRQNDSFLRNAAMLVEALTSYIADNDCYYLLPAVHRMCVTLFDDGVLRYSLQDSPARIRSLAKVPEFAAGIKRSRMRDYTWAGRVKLATLKLRLYRLYGALLTIRQRRPAARPR